MQSGDESNHRQESETPSLESKSKSFVGSFVPFKGISAISSTSRKEDKLTGGLPCFSVGPRPAPAVPDDHRSVTCSASKPIASCQVSPPGSSHVTLQSQQQALRKARRCWSPELHRRFVAALQQLGGAQGSKIGKKNFTFLTFLLYLFNDCKCTMLFYLQSQLQNK